MFAPQPHLLLGATYVEAEVEVAKEITFDMGVVSGKNRTPSYWLIEENSDL